LKQAKERPGDTLEQIGKSNAFLNITQISQQLREKIDKWDYMKFKTICTTKEMAIRLKGQSKEWEKIFASYISDKGLVTRIYRELKKLTSQKINDLMKKWANELNRAFSNGEVQMAKKHIKKCSTSLTIKGMQIKTSPRVHVNPVRMAIICFLNKI
jgi:DNA-directed RNA polymerase alpha subunit